jgi:(p)ppGpp synthase/HD superfamily hydrolase
MNGYSDDINHAFAFTAKYRAPYAPAQGAMTFVAHPANVAVILARHGADEVTLVAAILHHVLEVTPHQAHHGVAARIEDKFGHAVLRLAQDACEPREDDHGVATPWTHRKRAQLDRLLRISPRAIDICCADDIHDCGTALAIVERLGGEYLATNGLPASPVDLCCYDDLFEALDRRNDWHARGMRSELHALRLRLQSALRDAN